MALWTPVDIATSLWLDGADGLSAATWSDKSGNGFDADQPSIGSQPTIVANALNSLPGARFDGIDDYYSLGDVLDLHTGGHAIFVVAKFSTSSDQAIIAKSLYAAAPSRWALSRVSGQLGNFYTSDLSAGSIASVSYASTSPAIIAGILNRGEAPSNSLWVDGTQVGGVTPPVESVDLNIASRTLIGAYNNATDTGQLLHFSGDINEIIVISGSIVDDDRNRIEGYLAWKWGLNLNLPAAHPYRAAAPEIYAGSVVRAVLDQPWAIRMGSDLQQRWSDAPIIKGLLHQPWGNAGVIKAQLVQRWRDMVTLRAALDQPWAIMESLLVALEQPWAITSGPVQALLDQGWNIRDVEQVMAVLHQPWSIASDGTVLRYAVTVLAGGQPVRVSHINIEGGFDDSGDVLTCDLHLATEAEYLLCTFGAELLVTITSQEGTDSFSIVVTSPKPSEAHGNNAWVIEAMSPAVLLGAPYANVIDGELSGLASDIAATLAGDIALSWETVDWHIPAATWIASGETPLALLKTLAATVGALVQSDPDGTIAIRPRYPVSLQNWATATPGHVFTETLDCFENGSTPEHRYGYNRFLVSNQSSSADSLTLEQTDISGTVKEVRGYQVPWDGLFDLAHTGGAWVVIEPLGIEERDETETIEFVAGAGKVRYPLHRLVSVAWRQTNLGTITTAEDGSLTASISGQSLCEITYTTRCRLWKVTDGNNEQLQLVAEL